MEIEIETGDEDLVQQTELPARETPVAESTVESPVGAPLIQMPAAPGVTRDRRLVSHLSKVELPTDFDARAQAERDEVAKAVGNVPVTYAEAVKALHEANAIVPKDKFEALVKAAKLERLRALVHTLGQGAAAPTVPLKEHFKRTPDASALARINDLYPKPQKAKKLAN
jgi:hypothetical protein